jgi:hypothetical protein
MKNTMSLLEAVEFLVGLQDGENDQLAQAIDVVVGGLKFGHEEFNQVELSSLSWTAEDFDNHVEGLYDLGKIDESTAKKLMAYRESEKLGIVSNAIEDIEDSIMEKINDSIFLRVRIEANQVKNQSNA